MRLPVFEIEEQLQRACPDGARLLLKAPTGSGKSTAVPGMLLDAGLDGRVLVIEPRRMAARMLAGWVARQRGGAPGGEVGYSVRFDRRYGDATRIIYVTDGVFQRWLQNEPDLRGVAAVVFDEFHERRLAMDVALGRCLDLQEGSRPDLRVVVMSATLETAGLAGFLARGKDGGSTRFTSLEAGGRIFPVTVSHRGSGTPTDRRGGSAREEPVWERVAAACREAIADPECGNVLCFLPGGHEIRRTVSAIESATWSRGWKVMPLHGGLSPQAQEAAIAPGGGRRIIVSTNIAETSLTIDGVRTVVDAGLARIASFDPRRGIDTLMVEKISRAAAEQRAGRAGRTSPGRCFRLWSEADHARRPAFEIPEVHRVDLGETLLLLKAAGVGEVRNFRWLDPPTEELLQRAEALLHDLGAIDAAGGLTDEGRAMAALPLEPRFARLMLAGVAEGCVSEMAFVSAAVQGEGLWAGNGDEGMRNFVEDGDYTDFQAEWRGFESAAAMGFDPARVSRIGVHGRAARELAKGFERLEKLAIRNGWPFETIDWNRNRTAVGRAMLEGFSDRVGVRQGAATMACRMVGRRRGRVDERSAAREAPVFIGSEVTEVEGRDVTVHVRRLTAFDPQWLEDVFPDELKMVDEAVWDEPRRGVVSRRERRFRDLVLESSDSDRGVNLDAAAELLAGRVLTGELRLKRWDDKVEQWCARLAGLSRWMPELELPGWSDDDRQAAVAQICHGSIRYKDIKDAEVWPVLHDWLSAPQRAALDAYAPERVKLAGGREAKVRYAFDGDPVIGVMVRDLFGQWTTPTIVGGRVRLKVEVQAPNRRPWQVTSDLESFWERGYAQMRKDLAGRYPKHPWPEDPRAGE